MMEANCHWLPNAYHILDHACPLVSHCTYNVQWIDRLFDHDQWKGRVHKDQHASASDSSRTCMGRMNKIKRLDNGLKKTKKKIKSSIPLTVYNYGRIGGTHKLMSARIQWTIGFIVTFDAILFDGRSFHTGVTPIDIIQLQLLQTLIDLLQ